MLSCAQVGRLDNIASLCNVLLWCPLDMRHPLFYDFGLPMLNKEKEQHDYTLYESLRLLSPIWHIQTHAFNALFPLASI